MDFKEFRKTETGKKVEAAAWQMSVLALGIVAVYAAEANVAWLLPYVGIMNQLTKWINTNYLQ